MRDFEVPMQLVAVFAAGVGALLVVPLILSVRRRERCPTCGKRAIVAASAVLATVRDDDGRPTPAHETSYRCRACGGEFVRFNRGPLIARVAWEAGARDELPQARVVK